MTREERHGARLTAAARRAQLIDVGRAVFAKHGYEATTVEEIAERARISKPVVYEHFGGKEGLYAVIVDREVEHIVGRIVEAVTSGSPRERLEQAVLAFLSYAKERPDGFAMLLRESEHRGSATFDRVIALARGARGADPEGYRSEFVTLVETATSFGMIDTSPQSPAPTPKSRRFTVALPCSTGRSPGVQVMASDTRFLTPRSSRVPSATYRSPPTLRKPVAV